MERRHQLQALLTELVGPSGRAYFQPPSSTQMVYPAIVYSRDGSDVEHADNAPYRIMKRYQATVIDRDPDSKIPDKLEALPHCSFQRQFRADNLNHTIFQLFF